MLSWTLAEHGDQPEREWAAAISSRFPNYERFWAIHVVPLTYRIVDPHNILVRPTIRKELEDLGTSHYAVFLNLVACHRLLRSDGATFARQEVPNFYSRLYSVREMARRSLAAVKVVLREYGGVCIPNEKRRFDAHGKPGLSARVTEAFETRTCDYRRQQVHGWGLPNIDEKIPRRKFLARWLGKGLGEIARFRIEANVEQRVATEFVDALEQATDDLTFVEDVLNDVWEMALGELDGLRDVDRYRKDQRAGGNVGPSGPAGRIFQWNVSSSSSSGTWGPQGQL
jgi:hypothetical protein